MMIFKNVSDDHDSGEDWLLLFLQSIGYDDNHGDFFDHYGHDDGQY